MLRRSFMLFLLIAISFVSIAREGMWIPLLLDRNIAEMQEMGFKLNAKDIYDVNQSSLKDAIVLFGRGCTGELISNDGLMITNHHCGFSQIQSHSSLENDYLTDGFWAMNHDEELPNEGLSVSFLVEMREVTEQVLLGTDSLISENAITIKTNENIDSLKIEATLDNHYQASVKPFFEGNQYFLFITEKFTDVRLVGAPPSAIGKFGGDTDNWMWPRHTGDFSMFRIYADSTNNPANYSPDNVPYHPRKYLPINISGINEGDFTMVFGYPGSTQQYLHSKAVEQIVNQRDPDRIAIRDIKLEIMRSAMQTDRGTRIQYAAKYASTSNAWKKWQGEIKGLNRLNAVSHKQKQEAALAQWIEQKADRKYNYGSVLKEFDTLYAEIVPYQKAKDYYDEIIIRGTDAFKMYYRYSKLIGNNSFDKIKEEEIIDKHFKDYQMELDKAVFIALFKKYKNDINPNLLPESLHSIFNKKDADKYLSRIYSKSFLNNPESLKKLISNSKIENKSKRDQLFSLLDDLVNHYHDKVSVDFYRISDQIKRNQKIYMEALLEQNEGKMLFPDANLTLRVTYGKVEGYQPYDGAKYKHYTTLKGIIEKDNPEIYDYDVPDRLKELFALKNYGAYANSTGELPICFTASNHTTGGNSGSPVIDANGSLIGINFDRCWEGTMSDIMFDPAKCRNIALDMRYMLFLIDKFAGAGYLLDEMEIIK